MLRNKTKPVKFELNYQYGRKSGDANTSMGNTIINCGAFKYVSEKLGMNSSNTSVALMLGDDNLFGTDVDLDIPTLEKAFSEAGLVAKVKIHETIYTSKFLQCLPVPITIEG